MSVLRIVAPVRGALRSARVSALAPRVVPRQQTVLPSLALRFRSSVARSPFAKDPIITYDELKPITMEPSEDVLIMDVREPEEAELGMIPSATHLPLGELKEALSPDYHPGLFLKKYRFEKPTRDQNIVVYCRSGKRSATAAEIAEELGYHNVRNYSGSWLDWTERNKGKEDEEEDDD